MTNVNTSKQWDGRSTTNICTKKNKKMEKMGSIPIPEECYGPCAM